VPLSRPRSADVEKSPVFVELKEYLWERLKNMQQPSDAAAGGENV
jgi:hypothetical protein